MESIANSYGLAIFELANEDHDLDGYKKDLDFVLSALDDEALRFLNQPLVDKEARLALLDQCFKDSVKTNILNFLKVLVQKGRITHLKEICQEFKNKYNEVNEILEGTVYSLRPLDEKSVQEIALALSKREGKTVVLTTKQDESLIGGIKVVINDRVYDGSVKNKFDLLQSKLLKGSR